MVSAAPAIDAARRNRLNRASDLLDRGQSGQPETDRRRDTSTELTLGVRAGIPDQPLLTAIGHELGAGMDRAGKHEQRPVARRLLRQAFAAVEDSSGVANR